MQRQHVITAVTFLMAACAAIAAPPSSSVTDLWELVFVDDFDGTMLDPNVWDITDNVPCSGSSSVCRQAANVVVSGGLLQLVTTDRDPADPPIVEYKTGRVDLNVGFTGGYFIEARSRPTADSGISNAIFGAGGNTAPPNVFQAFHFDANTFPNEWELALAGGGFDVSLTSADPFPGGTDLSDGFRNYALLQTEAGALVWNVDGATVASGQAAPGQLGTPTAGIAIGSAVRDDFGTVFDPIGTSMDLDWLEVWKQRDICLGGDNFNYPGGSLDGANRGLAWNGAWSVTGGTVEVEGLGNNLATEFLTLPTPVGDRIAAMSGDVAIRELSTPISLASGNTYWVSMLVKKDDAGDFRIQFRRISDSIVRWGFGADAAEGVFASAQTTSTAANAMPIDETVLMIAQMETIVSGGVDTSRIAIFRAGDPLPTSEADINWLAERTTGSSVSMTAFDIDIFAGNVEIDEIKIGLSLEDVLTPLGAPLAAESFDYADATLDGGTGGTGWSAPWITTQTGLNSNDDVSLAYPSSPSTQPLRGFGDTLCLTDGTAERSISDDFALSDTDTYFMSFLANKSGVGDLLVEGLDGNDNSRWRAGLRGANEVIGGVASTQSSANQGGNTNAASLDYPASVALTTSGSRIEQSGFAEVEQGFSPSVNPSSGDKWVSFLARKSADGSFSVNFDRDGAERWNIVVDADGTVTGSIFGDGTDSTAAGEFPNDESVLVISQFVGGTPDTIRVVLIKQGEPLPASAGSIVWDTEAMTSTSIFMNAIILRSISGTVEIDQVRFGETYESVTSTDNGLILADGFDYTGGALGGQGGWTGTLTVAGAVNNSLAYPSLTPAISLTSDGGRIVQNGAASATLSNIFPPLNHFSPAAKRWMSFLAQKDASGAFTVSGNRGSDDVKRFNIEVSADGTVRADIFAGTNSAPGVFPNDETVLVIARWTGDDASSPTNLTDRADILILRDGDTLPADEAAIDGDPNDPSDDLWTISHAGHTSVSMNELAITVSAGNVQIDEWVHGFTYESVIGSAVSNRNEDFDYGSGSINGNLNDVNDPNNANDDSIWSGNLNIIGGAPTFANTTVFVLSMFQSVGGPDDDTVFVKFFRSSSDLPSSAAAITDWDLTVSSQTNVTVSKVRISSTGGTQAKLDELKFGTTFASVTGLFLLPGDCDDNEVLDGSDWLCIEPCVDGPDSNVVDGCVDADLDGDLDSDVVDIAILQSSL